MMIDDETRFDHVSLGVGPRIVYTYTLVNLTASDITENDIRAFVRPEVVTGVCDNEHIKPSLQYGGILVYSYRGKEGNEIGRFEVNRDDCGYNAI